MVAAGDEIILEPTGAAGLEIVLVVFALLGLSFKVEMFIYVSGTHGGGVSL